METKRRNMVARFRATVRQRTTQRKLAKTVGTSDANVSHWLSGRHEPDLMAFARACEALDVSADYILGLTDDPTGRPTDKRTQSVPIVTITEAINGSPPPDPHRATLSLPSAWCPPSAVAIDATPLVVVVDLAFKFPLHTDGPNRGYPAWLGLLGLPYLVLLPEGPAIRQLFMAQDNEDGKAWRLRFVHPEDLCSEDFVTLPKTEPLSTIIKGRALAWIRRVPDTPTAAQRAALGMPP
ncbi:MAG: helix-turn-helix domain-containing protein [Thermoanaerobaculales bacterium]|nr:helix-turn-helix domain-containing protein [Thermoanaerobaculales bacterium]